MSDCSRVDHACDEAPHGSVSAVRQRVVVLVHLDLLGEVEVAVDEERILTEGVLQGPASPCDQVRIHRVPHGGEENLGPADGHVRARPTGLFLLGDKNNNIKSRSFESKQRNFPGYDSLTTGHGPVSY